jgi:uroporphyrinogen-III synthase
MSPPQSASDDSAVLAGRTIAVPETRQLDVLAGLLERRGAAVMRCPLVGIRDAPEQPPVIAWLKRRLATPSDDLIVFYTGEGVERLYDCARRAGIEADFVAALRRTRKLTRGPKPRRALRKLALDAELEAATPTTDGLIETLMKLELPHRRVAVQLYSPDQDMRLVDYLRRRSVEPDCVAPYVYASATEDAQVIELIVKLAGGEIDAIAFTSKAQVQRLNKLAHDKNLDAELSQGLAAARVAAIGPVVAAELEKSGFRVDAMPAQSFSMKPLVTALCESLATSGPPSPQPT